MRIINPKNDQVVREVQEATPEEVDSAYSSARAAQPAWANRPLEERLGVFRELSRLVTDRTDQLASILTEETGKPIRQSKNELTALLERIRFFVEHTPAELEPRTVHTSSSGDLQEIIRQEPLGVIANISAWNYPYFVGANVFVPALLTGNAVLYKPSEFATLTGLEIGRLVHDAGVPPECFSVLAGGPEVGSRLVDQPIDGLFFTGSHATGKKLALRVAPRFVRLGLELGGKDPAYVAEDVAPDAAARAVADGAFYNAGQSCCAVERVYVHAAIWQNFLDHFVREVAAFVIGDPSSDTTYIGPLARRQAQIELLEQQVADALAKGATLLTGGKRKPGPGYYFEPTVLADVNHQMRVMKEESFGPIIGLMKVSSDQQALELMDDTEYGLTAAVYTADRTRAERILGELKVGSAYWNCCDRVSPRLPWSGRRCSGIGSTLSTYGIHSFVTPKAWHLRR